MRSQTNIHMIATNRAFAMIGVAEGLAHWLGSVAQRIQDRRGLRPLMGMDDYALKDIGVSRADVEGEFSKPLLWRIGG
jgi:uncharacterized protein YjiS (DUF1127 family)